MRTAIFDMMEYEWQLFQQCRDAGKDIWGTASPLNLDSCPNTVGFDAVSINSHSVLNKELLLALHKNGVRCVSTRTVGVEHMDIEAAAQLGIRLYSSHVETSNVSDFTVMMILCLLRKAGTLIDKQNWQDFSLDGICGRELKSCTVGIIGTGRIGANVIRALSGFGCRICAYDPTPREALKHLCEYVSFESLLRNSDIISLHTPLSAKTERMLNKDTFAMMKEGVMLVNTSRGGVVDTEALRDAMERRQVLFAALDVLNKDEAYVHAKTECEPNREYEMLRPMMEEGRILYTPHCAFYTAEAVRSIFEEGIDFERPPLNG